MIRNLTCKLVSQNDGSDVVEQCANDGENARQINSVCADWHSSNHFSLIMTRLLSIAICPMTAAGPAHRITEEAAIGPNGHLHGIIEEAGHMHRKSTR